jgi:hypothetical protein
MRSLLLVLALYVCDSRALADDASPIPWSQARLLTWADFVSPVPGDIDAERVAATTAAISWSYKYTVEMTSTTCRYTITEIRSTAYFLPDESWVRPGHRNPEVLQHEQGHFDIAQIHSERFEAQTRDLLDLSGDCQGRNKRAAARFSEESIARILGAEYEAIWSEYRNHQEAYDGDTRHGSDATEQARWTGEILSMLSPADPANPAAD